MKIERTVSSVIRLSVVAILLSVILLTTGCQNNSDSGFSLQQKQEQPEKLPDEGPRLEE